MEKSNSLLANIALSINKRLAGRGGCGQVYYAIYSGREAVAKVATQTKHEDIILREYKMMKELASEYTVAAIVFLHGASITLPEEEDKVPIPRSCLFMEWMNWGKLFLTQVHWDSILSRKVNWMQWNQNSSKSEM